VLGCKLAQVRAVVLTCLENGEVSRAAFAGNTTQDLAGLMVLNLPVAAGARTSASRHWCRLAACV